MATWTGYTRLARQLDALYRDDEQQAAGHAAQREAVAAAVARLDHRLGAQHQRLRRLHEVLDEPLAAPPLPPPPPGPAGGAVVAQALQLAGQHADLADAALTEAEQVAQQPRLLPDLPTQTRNLAVYGGCALVAVVAVYALLIASDITNIAGWMLLGSSCAGFPLLAWIAGYLVIGALGRPRIGDATVSRSPRLGLAVCLIAVPVSLCAFQVVTHLL
jgi:hypothetical protein